VGTSLDLVPSQLKVYMWLIAGNPLVSPTALGRYSDRGQCLLHVHQKDPTCIEASALWESLEIPIGLMALVSETRGNVAMLPQTWDIKLNLQTIW
jgi:hypothetical protein